MKLVVGATGASGAPLTLALVRVLCGHSQVSEVHLVHSGTFPQVCGAELGIDVKIFCSQADGGSGKLQVFTGQDFSAPMASGSARLDAMVVMPCSMGSLSAIANGASKNLLTRAADVMLKEGRPLLLAVRETPLSLVHLRNMTAAAEAGARIIPFLPAFYHRPKSIDDLVRHYLARILDQLGLEQDMSLRWGQGSDPS